MSKADTTREVTLKEAVKLCGKSEKTLRRKIEAGSLAGRRENLEYGGFMWLIDLASLETLYPGSAPKSLLEGAVATEPPPTRLSTTPSAPTPPPSETPQPTPEGSEVIALGATPNPPGQGQFFEYLLEENRDLKSELRERDGRIATLQEKTARLERQLGEQEGTATTQSRVLEWFQRQEFRPALPPASGTVDSATSVRVGSDDFEKPSVQTMVITLLAALGTTLALLMFAGQISFIG